MQKNSGDFYTQLAYWYDEIFPVSIAQVDFVRRIIDAHSGDRQPRLLDVGCGTGGLALTLSVLGVKAVGVDINKDMIDQARLKSESVGSTPEFYVEDMHELADNLAGMTFDVITCLGNTLVHLDGPEAVRNVLKQFSRLMTRKGALVIQIINYDKVISESIKELPLIEAEGITFERCYDWKEGSASVMFKTRLNTPNVPKPIEQETALYPLRRQQLDDILAELGFSSRRYYGSFEGAPDDGSALPLIVHASR